MRRIATLVFLLLLAPLLLDAAPTRVRGVVIDGQSGETLPYVSVVFLGSSIGVMTDLDGAFSIENLRDYTRLSFQMLGYQTREVNVEAGVTTEGLRIVLQPDAYGLESAIVKPKRNGPYRRKGNPAVELARQVIARKWDNHVRASGGYRSSNYSKQVISLDRFEVDFDSSRFWRNFSFFEKYVDTAQFENPVLPFTLREELSDTWYQEQPRRTRTLVSRRRRLGLDYELDHGSIGDNIRAIFRGSDICEDNIDLLLNRFVSPLSTSMGTSFYKYFITDTLQVDGVECIDLSFVPSNNRSYGFTGHLYVVNDGSYAIKKYSMGLPGRINLNFVSELAIEENFERTDQGFWVSTGKDTYARFYIFKWVRQLFAHQQIVHYDYDFTQKAVPDSLLQLPDEIHYGTGLGMPAEQWAARRPVPLREKETLLDSLGVEIRREPRLSDIVDAVETVSTAYMPTTRNRSASLWDYGPIFNFIHYNATEGLRLRVGGMSTGNFSPHHFMSMYGAYGFADHRLKGNLNYTYSFAPRDYHPFEALRHLVSAQFSYDLDAPGQRFESMDRDNFMRSTITPQPLLYVRRWQLLYQHEWASHLFLDSRIQLDRNEPAGTLSYQRISASGDLEPVRFYDDLSWTTQLRFTPGKPMSYNRLGQDAQFQASRDAPTLSLSHTLGRFDHSFTYNRTDFSVQKRFWLSAFGHIDASLNAGMVWNQVPLPKLYTPSTNPSLFLQGDAFNLMTPMEFIMDRYATVSATYFLKGWLLNRVPLIRRLGLREVVSFRAMVGSLSERNNPAHNGAGLYTFPAGSRAPGREPYMEYTLGVENIFNLVRLDYVRRISYTEGLLPEERGGFRVSLRVSL